MGAGHAHALYVHGHSPVHRLAPEVKLAAAVTFVFGVALTPREAVWAFAVHALVVAAVIAVSGIPVSFVLARITVVAPFIVFALLIPFIGSGERVDVLGIALSRDGLWSTWNIVGKATLGATVSVLLSGTTEIPELLKGMNRLRVPATLTMIAAFMIRYLELLATELRRTRIAMTARGYDPRWLWQIRPLAASAGALFIRSYERGERVHAAMLARGYSGRMPADPSDRRATAAEWSLASLFPLAAWAAAAVAIGTAP